MANAPASWQGTFREGALRRSRLERASRARGHEYRVCARSLVAASSVAPALCRPVLGLRSAAMPLYALSLVAWAPRSGGGAGGSPKACARCLLGRRRPPPCSELRARLYIHARVPDCCPLQAAPPQRALPERALPYDAGAAAMYSPASWLRSRFEPMPARTPRHAAWGRRLADRAERRRVRRAPRSMTEPSGEVASPRSGRSPLLITLPDVYATRYISRNWQCLYCSVLGSSRDPRKISKLHPLHG